MPQELHVLRCYSCHMFQVHIVKKSIRWVCKVCGEKQSLTKVYGRGIGKDCRIIAQKLNELYKQQENDEKTEPNTTASSSEQFTEASICEGRWSKYLDSEQANATLDVEENAKSEQEQILSESKSSTFLEPSNMNPEQDEKVIEIRKEKKDSGMRNIFDDGNDDLDSIVYFQF